MKLPGLVIDSLHAFGVLGGGGNEVVVSVIVVVAVVVIVVVACGNGYITHTYGRKSPEKTIPETLVSRPSMENCIFHL